MKRTQVVAPAELVCPKGYQEVPQASERDAGMTTPRMAKPSSRLKKGAYRTIHNHAQAVGPGS